MTRFLCLLVCCFLVFAAAIASVASTSATPVDDRYRFQPERRINAHGNEFMALAITSDAKRLIVGTESGVIIVWGIPERQIVKQLDQGSPVHCVVTLKDSDTFVAAGGVHSGPTQSSVIRKWKISSGKFETWQSSGKSTFLSLTTDPATGLVAAADATGNLFVWNSETSQMVWNRLVDGIILGLALSGREILLTKAIDNDRQDNELSPNSILRFFIDSADQPASEFQKQAAGRVWAELKNSPDRRFLAAHTTGSDESVVLLEASTAKEVATFDTHAAAWSPNGNLILFDRELPIARITLNAGGDFSRSELLKSGSWHRAGTPSNMTGQVVSPDGSKAWHVFQLTAALIESDLNKKSVDVLHDLRGNVYAIHAHEHVGLLATGGDDGFVRVRNLSDLSLVREFHVTPGVPQGVALMDDGRHVVFSSSLRDTPSRICIGDLVTGETRILFEFPEPFVRVVRADKGFVYDRGDTLVLAGGITGTTVREFKLANLQQFAVSANGKWLVAANERGKLFGFDITTGKRRFESNLAVDSLTRLTITGNGHHVYTTDFQASLKKWDTTSGTAKELAKLRGQARALVLSSDEERIMVGGNHRDVQVFEVATGETLVSVEVAASDFYVTNIWLRGDRLLFTTDAGVLYDGLLLPVKEQ